MNNIEIKDEYMGLLGLLIFLKANPTKNTTPEWLEDKLDYIYNKIDKIEIAQNESFEEIRKISAEEQTQGYA